jgi:hypothetical protein
VLPVAALGGTTPRGSEEIEHGSCREVKARVTTDGEGEI